MDLTDVTAFVEVARAGGYRPVARARGTSASSLSDAIRRLEGQLGVRLLHRTTRAVSLTEAGAALLARLQPAIGEVHAALDAANAFRDRAKGTLKLNVPTAASRVFLPALLQDFVRAEPDITVEVVVDDSFVDILAAGCDAGIRYGETLAQDMVAVPIGPRHQRIAVAAAPAYLGARGQPRHPTDLLQHDCLLLRFPGGRLAEWSFEKDGERVDVEARGPLVASTLAADLAVSAAVAGLGIIALFEDWLRPELEQQALVPVLEPWWPAFPGPYLYYASRRFLPAPLRAFVDFLQRRTGPIDTGTRIG